jgi:beta-xylosidase
MYYSGEAKEMVRHHCVGVAVSQSTDPTGPYVPNETPLSCRLDQGGSIDPAGFVDKDGSRYVIFKVDGNSIGHGGDCNNGITPLVPTPILLQKVEDDGFTLIGDAVPILDRGDSDGPLVEAPNLILHGDTYFLFYSTHCFTDTKYDVRWATSKSITGPYIKSGRKLFKTGDYALTSPGGGTVYGCGDKILFHGFCEPNKRCTYAANIAIDGDEVTVL